MLSHALAAVFFVLSMIFVWRSFYGMRIGVGRGLACRSESAAADGRGPFRRIRCLSSLATVSLTLSFCTDYNRRPLAGGLPMRAWPAFWLSAKPLRRRSSVPRDMFGDIVDPSIKVGSQKWYTVPLSIIVHTVAHRRRRHHPADGGRRAADAAVDDGVRRRAAAAAAATATAAAAAGGRGAEAGRWTSTRRPRRSRRRRKSSLKRASKRASRAPSAASKAASSAASTGGIVGGLEAAPPPPPPPPPPPAPVRVGGKIKQPSKIKDVKPVYPPIAQSARVQGVVIIEATIGPNGAVQEAKVLRSIPLLDAAALDAVKQWAVHADAAERRAGAGHHDGDRELHAAVSQFEADS